MTEGRYEIGSVLRGHSTYRRVKEDVMKEVSFEQVFTSQAGFLETNSRGRRDSAETFQAVEMAGAKRWKQELSNVRAKRKLGDQIV